MRTCSASCITGWLFATVSVGIASVNGKALAVCALCSSAEQTLSAFVRIGVLAQDQRNDDRAIEAAIAQLCRAGFRAIEAGSA